MELPAGIRPALKRIASVVPRATRLFDGVAIQSVLGARCATLFPQPGHGHTVRVPELDEHRIVEARHENKVLVLLGERCGHDDQFGLRFDAACRTYDLRRAEDVS